MPADSDGAILAVTNGWINPLPRFMHCETLQVFTRNQAGKGEGAIPGGLLGLGVFVGVATFAYAISQGCKRAEILAINDSGALPPAPDMSTHVRLSCGTLLQLHSPLRACCRVAGLEPQPSAAGAAGLAAPAPALLLRALQAPRSAAAQACPRRIPTRPRARLGR